MHQPTDIDSQLLRFWPRQHHAIVKRVQKTALANPFFFFDKDAMHHRYLTRWAAEAQ
jgi:hypothetical protein